MTDSQENHKVKRKSLSINDRCSILERLEAGQSASEIASQFKISKSAVFGIKKNKDRLLETKRALEQCDGNLEKKRYKAIEESQLEVKLLKWFTQRQSMNLPVTGSMLKKQALKYNKYLEKKENFTASDGWLEKFKLRHGWKSKKIHGEELSADLEASEEFAAKIGQLREITGTNLDLIYNCDETGLFWKILPDSTYVRKHEPAEDHKKAKNRFTVMLCTNASGSHKLPLFIIGKRAQPRCLKAVKNLPVYYTHQENAWMTTEGMQTWYTQVFLPDVRKHHDLENNPHKKVILIMDNAACHPPAEELNALFDSCSVVYLPPKVTSLIQPLDQGIIEKFKRCYRMNLLEKVLIDKESQERTELIGDHFLKSVEFLNILDALNFCALAWSEVTATDVQNCWKNVVSCETNTTGNPRIEYINNQHFYDFIHTIQDFRRLSREEVDYWLQVDAGENGWQPYSDDDILSNRIPDSDKPNSVQELDDEISYEDEDCTATDWIIQESCPTFIEALSGLNTFMKWYQRNGDYDESIFEFHQRAHRALRKSRLNDLT